MIISGKKAAAGPFITLLIATIAVYATAEPIDIGTRLEPLVDAFLIDELDSVEFRLHNPVPREVAITFDAPWEGNVSCYVTVFQDDDRYRMYYRGTNYDLETGAYSNEVICYAESTDGFTWTKPELGLFEYDGSKANNIVWDGIGDHNLTPFKDTNPDCKPEERYKAIARDGTKGLVIYTSPDAINWTLVSEEPVITKGAFDSQNLAFYDNVRGHYVDFHRGFKDGVRHIMTCTSEDFRNWTEPEWVDFGDTPDEHLYTNATVAYPRAPHIFMAFPKRFIPKRQTLVHPIQGVSDGVFMTSRDGKHWNRWQEALIRPGAQDSRWVNRNNMIAWGLLTLPGDLPGTPDELSLYATEGYYVGPCHLRRFSIRQDGFVSVHAGGEPGEFITNEIVFGDDPAITTPLSSVKSFTLTAEAPHGSGALKFHQAATIDLPNTKDLGNQATLAAVVHDVPKGRRRLFSGYDGGAIQDTQGELWFDIDPSNEDTSIRFGAFGELVEVDSAKLPDWREGGDNAGPHHVAVTWDDGAVTIYFDGQIVGEGGTPGRGSLAVAQPNLRFGEDFEPTNLANERFLGVVDNITVLRRALGPEEMAKFAVEGAGAITPAEGDLLLDFENIKDGRLANAWKPAESSPTLLPGHEAQAEVALTLNYATSGAGYLRCEILDANHVAIPGFRLDQCDEIFGDDIRRPVSWNGNAEMKSLAGTPVRLRFQLFDADLYALQFQ